MVDRSRCMIENVLQSRFFPNSLEVPNISRLRDSSNFGDSSLSETIAKGTVIVSIPGITDVIVGEEFLVLF